MYIIVTAWLAIPGWRATMSTRTVAAGQRGQSGTQPGWTQRLSGWLRLLVEVGPGYAELGSGPKSSGGAAGQGSGNPHLLYFGQEPLVAWIAVESIQDMPLIDALKPAASLRVCGFLQSFKRLTSLP